MGMIRLVSKMVGVNGFEGFSGEQLVIAKARRSSNRPPDKILDKGEGLIRHMLTNGHWSPFDMAIIGFEIECSVAISIQLLRHWSFKVQQFSQRYAEVQEVMPVKMRQAGSKNRQSSTVLSGINEQMLASESILESLANYQELLEAGVAKETARFVLPMAAKSSLYYNGTFRSIITFLNQRLSKDAQKEVRVLAEGMRDIFIQEAPIISRALNNFKGADEIPILDQLVVMNNLDKIEKIKSFWNE